MEPEKKSNGALMGSIIIIVILIIAGVYLWKNSVREKIEPTSNAASDTKELMEADANSTTSIETELDGMDLDGLDSDI